MKKDKGKENFLKQIGEYSNVLVACKKIDISRNTYYRWRKEDPQFANKADLAISFGNEDINDLADNELVKAIKNGDQKAVKYRLSHCHPNYMPTKIDTVILNHAKEQEKEKQLNLLKKAEDEIRLEKFDKVYSKTNFPVSKTHLTRLLRSGMIDYKTYSNELPNCVDQSVTQESYEEFLEKVKPNTKDIFDKYLEIKESSMNMINQNDGNLEKITEKKIQIEDDSEFAEAEREYFQELTT